MMLRKVKNREEMKCSAEEIVKKCTVMVGQRCLRFYLKCTMKLQMKLMNGPKMLVMLLEVEIVHIEMLMIVLIHGPMSAGM